MKVKIISDGSFYGETKVVNAETGEEIENIAGIEWSCFHDGLSYCTVTIVDVDAEITADAKIKKEAPA